ncbi:NACHT domain protein [Theileria parva strain Muguga]|uniref:NACHT domain protein n=1 Tax=Theileria parva strain Muguga TaxID=333668 RepID=UPI001C61F5BE|nr:NACHT domain protein [Theileria parva strain Muguga]KAF5153293.1 NACHT domain protein [Theileria parva strain Muguga]
MNRIINFNIKNIKLNIVNNISKPTNKQIWLVGPEGRGKTTLIHGILDHLKNNKAESYITTYFDFKNVKDFNFQTALVKYVDSIINSASKLTQTNSKQLERVFLDLNVRFPKFNQHISSFFNHLKNSNVLKSNHKWIQSVSSLKDGISFGDWWNLCMMTYELNPKSFGVSKQVNFNSAQLFLLFVNSIACLIDMENCQHITPLSSSVTGQWVISYVLESIKLMMREEKMNWIICNDGIDHLVRSPFLSDRGPVFLSHLLLNLQISSLPSVFISNDSTVPLLLTNKHYEKLFNNNVNNSMTINRSYDPNNFIFHQVDEISQEETMNYLNSKLAFGEKFMKCIWKITGGNLSLINKVFEDYEEFVKKVSLGTVQQILSGSTSVVDDEYFPINKSKEEQINYLREEQFKMFLKTLQHDTFNPDIIKFENMMSSFLSSVAIEEMKLNMKNLVHFKVLVFETIRYLLNKKWLRVKDGVTINNKIILGLIEANILYYEIPSMMLEFKNSLVKYLLNSYIQIQYEMLKAIEKIEYKANFLLNQKTLYRDLDNLFI